MSILELMDYGAAYKGNFLSSILTLCENSDEEVVLVFPGRTAKRDYIPEIANTGIPIYFLPDGLFPRIKFLRHVLRKHSVRVVHSHFLNGDIYVPLRIASLLHPCRHIFHAHSLPHFPKKGLQTVLRKRLLHAEQIFCVSDAVKRAYEERGFSRCITIPNGIDFDRLETAECLPKSNTRVLMFGYDFSIKGIDTALKAFRDFDTEHRFTLCICVANHMDKAKEQLHEMFGAIPDFVQLLEPRNDVGTYYKNADIFLSASRTEGMPYAVLEAAYCDLPIALSRIAPHEELHLPNAVFFDVDDPKQLFEAVCIAEKSPASSENHSFVSQNFSLNSWTEQVLHSFPSL